MISFGRTLPQWLKNPSLAFVEISDANLGKSFILVQKKDTWGFFNSVQTCEQAYTNNYLQSLTPEQKVTSEFCQEEQ